MIPGSDLLDLALSVQGTQTVKWHKFVSRGTNEIGLDVAVYKPPVLIEGSFQPVPRRVYQQYGLDFNRNYATFYVSQNLADVNRDSSGDKVTFNGRDWECLGANDWFPIDGWLSMLLVQFDKNSGGACA